MGGTSASATFALDRYRHQLIQLEGQVRKFYDAQCHSGEIRLVRVPAAGESVLAAWNGYLLVWTNLKRYN